MYKYIYIYIYIYTGNICKCCKTCRFWDPILCAVGSRTEDLELNCPNPSRQGILYVKQVYTCTTFNHGKSRHLSPTIPDVYKLYTFICIPYIDYDLNLT